MLSWQLSCNLVPFFYMANLHTVLDFQRGWKQWRQEQIKCYTKSACLSKPPTPDLDLSSSDCLLIVWALGHYIQTSECLPIRTWWFSFSCVDLGVGKSKRRLHMSSLYGAWFSNWEAKPQWNPWEHNEGLRCQAFQPKYDFLRSIWGNWIPPRALSFVFFSMSNF